LKKKKRAETLEIGGGGFLLGGDATLGRTRIGLVKERGFQRGRKYLRVFPGCLGRIPKKMKFWKGKGLRPAKGAGKELFGVYLKRVAPLIGKQESGDLEEEGENPPYSVGARGLSNKPQVRPIK